MQHHHTVDASAVFAGPLGGELRARLAEHENVLAVVPVDLSADLQFGSGLLALTQERLLACDPKTQQWREWALAVDQSLRLQDHGGVGNLELHDPRERLAHWLITLKHQTAMLQLMQQFDRQRERIARQEVYSAVSEEDVAHCPVCHSVLPPDTEECPACARQQAPQTSTWVLLRLWRFAKPYQGQLLLGFLLTLATTAAQLVAPYLTIPLMDKILIPFQNGEKIDRDLVFFYLGMLLLSALLAWALGWGRTFVLAKVSERIGSNLRTPPPII